MFLPSPLRVDAGQRAEVLQDAVPVRGRIQAVHYVDDGEQRPLGLTPFVQLLHTHTRAWWCARGGGGGGGGRSKDGEAAVLALVLVRVCPPCNVASKHARERGNERA